MVAIELFASQPITYLHNVQMGYCQHKKHKAFSYIEVSLSRESMKVIHFLLS